MSSSSSSGPATKRIYFYDNKYYTKKEWRNETVQRIQSSYRYHYHPREYIRVSKDYSRIEIKVVIPRFSYSTQYIRPVGKDLRGLSGAGAIVDTLEEEFNDKLNTSVETITAAFEKWKKATRAKLEGFAADDITVSSNWSTMTVRGWRPTTVRERERLIKADERKTADAKLLRAKAAAARKKAKEAKEKEALGIAGQHIQQLSEAQLLRLMKKALKDKGLEVKPAAKT